MAFVDEAGYEFECFDIDLNDWDDDVVEAYIKFNCYDIVAYGSIVTHYKWMKWLTKTIKAYHPSTYTIVGNSVGGSCPEVFMSNCPVDFIVSGEGEETTVHLINVIKDRGDFSDVHGLVWRKTDNKIVKNPSRKATRFLDDLPVIR